MAREIHVLKSVTITVVVEDLVDERVHTAAPLNDDRTETPPETNAAMSNHNSRDNLHKYNNTQRGFTLDLPTTPVRS